MTVTPVTIQNVPVGAHTIKTTRAGYQDYTTTVTVVANQTVTVNATLIATTGTTGTITVVTSPSAASVYLDNVLKGSSPVTITGVSPGSHSIRLSKTGYDDLTQTVTVVANQTVTVSKTLVPNTVITHKACISGICTVVNGQGSDECTTIGAACGCVPAWVCENPLTGYEIDGCGNRRLNSNCNPTTNGILYISTLPVSAASVWIDTIDAGTTPTIISLSIGSHEIKISLDGYIDINDTINITAGDTIVKTYTLVPTTITASSISPVVVLVGLGIGAKVLRLI